MGPSFYILRPFFLLEQRVSFAFDLWIHFPSSPFFCAIFSPLNGIEFFPADSNSPNFQWQTSYWQTDVVLTIFKFEKVFVEELRKFICNYFFSVFLFRAGESIEQE